MKKPTMAPSRRSQVASPLHLLSLSMLLLHPISASTLPSLALPLTPRDTTSQCPDSTYTACTFPDVTFPPNFCCPQSTTCMAINSISVICCPSGQKCTAFAPVTCDPSLLDASAHPENPIHSTNTTSTLASCGSQCCPQGYTCQENTCVATKAPVAINSPVNAAPSSTSSSASTTSAPTSTPTLTSGALASSSATQSCASFPPGAIMAGLFPGLLLGLLLGILLTTLVSHRRHSKISPPLQSTEQNQNTYRTDFLRSSSTTAKKGPRSLSAMLLQRGRSIRSVKSVFTGSSSHSPSMTTATRMTPPMPMPGGLGVGFEDRADEDGRTHRHKSTAPSESTSMEFVLSEAPGGSVGMGSRERDRGRTESQVTNFADLMEGAGFKRGEGYLVAASPGAENGAKKGTGRGGGGGVV